MDKFFVADPQTSSSLGTDVTAQVFTTRREIREAEARAAAARAAAAPLVVAIAVEPPREAWAPRPSAPTLRRSSVPELRASATEKHKPKNPLSVLATMGIVAGMFAVAGLPAYALNTPELATSAKSVTVAQSIAVGSDVTVNAATRDGFTATTPEQLDQLNEDAIRAANDAAYVASGARGLGDDYPWPYELTDDQGGGLSPLNYYYRECVDFVAWRINRDQGYYGAPFKWVWSNLTPYGGNGGQWQYNWSALGRTVSDVPIAGAVAYTGGNHIAYVKSVNADGTVTLEEYNYIPGMYSQRVLAPSAVSAFLYPPS